jgi:hypothetical protein
MVEYTCDRCGYHTCFIGNYKKHLYRKKACEVIFDDTNIETLRDIVENVSKGFKCELCLKSFSSRQSKWFHKKTCKEVSSNSLLLEKIKELEERIKTQETKVYGHTINNNINIQNNFNMKTFGRENIDYLSHDFLNSCLLMNNIIPLIENIHFDKEHPENHNVKVKSIKQELMETFVDGKWIITDTDDTLNELIDKGYRVLNYHSRRNKNNILNTEMNEDEYDDVLEWLEKIYEDKKTRKPIKKQLLLLFLNNKTMLLGKEDD